MPLIEVVLRPEKIGPKAIKGLQENLPAFAAKELSCEEGGDLRPEDIMIEFHDMDPRNVHCKDIHVRIFAHDYLTRNITRDGIRLRISREVRRHLPEGVSWYVWLLLGPTSYGSDTEE